MKTLKILLAAIFVLLLTLAIASCGHNDGLEYELNEDRKTYSVVGIGTYQQSDLVIPSEYRGKKVTNIGDDAFFGCTGLTSITIPDSVTSIEKYAFANCVGLTSVTIPNSVTSIETDAFYGCTGLTSITIPDSVTSIEKHVFANCAGLTSITVNENNPVYYSEGNCLIAKESNELVVGCQTSVIPDNVTSIGDYAFFGCTTLTSITIPDGVTSIGNYAFRGCTTLTSITIPDGVTSIGNYAFSSCTGLTSITVNENNPVYYSEGNCLIERESNRLVVGCQTSVIPDNVTSIGNYAFLGCTTLTSITIPEGVTSIGDSAFQGCTGLTSITIPDSVTDTWLPVFDECTALTNITFQGTMAQWESMGKDPYWSDDIPATVVHCTDGDVPIE